MTFIVSALGIAMAITIANYPPPAPNLTVMYSPPPANPYKQSVSASGIVEAYEDNIFIGVRVEGLVKDVFCEVGQKVTEGQLLFTVSDSTQRAKVEVAKTAIAYAFAQLEKAKSQLSRLTSIQDSRAVSQEDLRN